MKKTLLIVLVIGLSLGTWIFLGMFWPRHPEPGGGEIIISAEAIDNENVRLSITMTRAGFSPSFPPFENTKIFATVENGENTLVEVIWTGPVEIVWEGLRGERIDGIGSYKYGKNPMGKEIKVKWYVNGEQWGDWIVIISAVA